MTESYFTATEIGKLAHLVNSFGIVGAQLMLPDHYQRAQLNLAKIQAR